MLKRSFSQRLSSQLGRRQPSSLPRSLCKKIREGGSVLPVGCWMKMPRSHVVIVRCEKPRVCGSARRRNEKRKKKAKRKRKNGQKRNRPCGLVRSAPSSILCCVDPARYVASSTMQNPSSWPPSRIVGFSYLSCYLKIFDLLLSVFQSCFLGASIETRRHVALARSNAFANRVATDGIVLLISYLAGLKISNPWLFLLHFSLLIASVAPTMQNLVACLFLVLALAGMCVTLPFLNCLTLPLSGTVKCFR